MRVYAEFIEDDSLLFRTKTLLQFGDSWELIGSIVMKNPGSAKPLNNIDLETSKRISHFYNQDINSENWFISGGDNTMNEIKSIFNGSYIGKNIEINGVIQIFNLYNICSPNVDFAHKKGNETKSSFLITDVDEIISQFRNKPVYIGYGDFYTNKKSINREILRDSAVKIFEFVKNSDYDYLEDDYIINDQYFHRNHFYHPQYLKIIKPKDLEKYLPTLEKFAKFYI
ncbi:hypothetical protein JSO62_06350 [Riemerella anatipestifer]|uniref:hypothetical protein n=1 Tax=Riemerella anatipestifer TaxID=34085 RepID=UPI0030C623D4